MGHKVGEWENNKRIRTNAATDIVVNQLPEGYLLQVAKWSKRKKIIKNEENNADQYFWCWFTNTDT